MQVGRCCAVATYYGFVNLLLIIFFSYNKLANNTFRPACTLIREVVSTLSSSLRLHNKVKSKLRPCLVPKNFCFWVL